MEIGLVVPVLSNFHGLTELMRSVDRPVTPIIIDNYNGNRGVGPAWNEGIRRGWDQEVLVIVNDDVTFYPGTIDRLVRHLNNADLVSAVACDTEQHGLKTDGFPDFCCFAIKPIDFVNKFGWFDENFAPAYFEDNDMDYRIKLGGGVSGMALEAQVEHVGSFTQFKHTGDVNTSDRVVSHEQFDRNRAYYTAKWGGKPGEEKFKQPFNGISGKTFKDWTLTTKPQDSTMDQRG